MKMVIRGEVFDIDKSRLIKEFTKYKITRCFDSCVDLPFNFYLYQRDDGTYFVTCDKFGAKNITKEANEIINKKMEEKIGNRQI